MLCSSNLNLPLAVTCMMCFARLLYCNASGLSVCRMLFFPGALLP